GLKRLRLWDGPAAALDPDPGSPYARVSSLEMSLYMRNQLLRDADWAGMAHSLEVRVPYADAFLLKKIASLVAGHPGKNWKPELASSPRPALPASVRSRPKTG